jgi:hypothetical protein
MVHIQTNFTAEAMNTGKKADASVAPKKVEKSAKKDKPVVVEAPVVVEEVVVVEAPVVEEPVLAEPDAE